MASLYRQCIFISTYWENLLNKFMEELNQFLSNLKFTYKASRKKVTFLDVSVSFKRMTRISQTYINNLNQFCESDLIHVQNYLSNDPIVSCSDVKKNLKNICISNMNSKMKLMLEHLNISSLRNKFDQSLQLELVNDSMFLWCLRRNW